MTYLPTYTPTYLRIEFIDLEDHIGHQLVSSTTLCVELTQVGVGEGADQRPETVGVLHGEVL